MSEKLKKPYQTVTAVYVVLIFTFYLLFFDKNGLSAISKAKLVCYYTLTFSYIASVLFLLIYHGLAGKLRWQDVRTDLKNTPVAAWLILAYLLFTLVSALLSDYSTVWLGRPEAVFRREGALTISLYCISFLLISRFYRPTRWHLYMFAAGASAFCVICIFQLLNINIFGLYPLGDALSCADFSDRFIGTIGNIDFTASYLCIAIPIFWCCTLRLSGRQRFLLCIPLLLCLFILWKINVAAGFVGILVGTLLSLPVVLPCKKKTRIMVMIAVAAMFAVGLFVIYYVDFGQKELHQLRVILHGKIKDSYGTGRVYIWRRTLQAVPAHFWFGTGPDTMSYALFARRNGLIFDAAHNEYLTVLYHQGIFALLSYLGALIYTSVQWVRQSGENTVAAISGAAVLCYCLQAFFSISQLITSPFFWCVFAILVNALCDKKRQNARR